MSLNADLREFIELLNSRGVEYVIVGAHSLAFHGLYSEQRIVNSK